MEVTKMGDTATGSWGSRELGHHIAREKMRVFTASEFVPTQWDTAEQKAKFANQFAKFVLSDFAASRFPHWFYNRLSMTFGHIAHYNQGGFYSTWFADTAGKLDFLKRTVEHPHYGDPSFTYSDVEKVLHEWVRANGFITTYTDKLRKEREASERATLAALKAKYEPEPKDSIGE
jgi:hypothetical protein